MEEKCFVCNKKATALVFDDLLGRFYLCDKHFRELNAKPRKQKRKRRK